MKYIVSSAQGGLSNRIKCLISSMKISYKIKRKLMLYWPRDPACNCNFQDLFEDEIKEIKKENLRKILKSKKYTLTQENKPLSDKRPFIINPSPLLFPFGEKDQKDFLEISPEKRKEIISYLKKLRIKKQILKKVDEFSRKKLSKNTVGIHVRRGDFKNINNLSKISSDEEFIKIIKYELQKNPKTKFFLATDEKETEDKLKKLFPNKIIICKKNSSKREGEGSVEEAFIELLLLSKCNKIIGSFSSSFTEMSWFFGSCKPEIEIACDKAELKKWAQKSRKKSSLPQKTKRLLYEFFTPFHVRFLDKK